MHEPGATPAPVFGSKAEMYDWLTKQAVALVADMSSKLTPQANLVIGLANVAALYFYELNRFADPQATLQDGLPVNWFGFYLLQGAGVLALGPFQGRPACTQIRVGRGVCGKAAEAGTTLVVADVHAFADHIACDSASRSEVVVPIRLAATHDAAPLQQQQQQQPPSSSSAAGAVLGVIDVDSVRLSHFDDVDAAGLERLAEVLATHLHFPSARALAANPTLASAQPSYAAAPAAPPAAAIQVQQAQDTMAETAVATSPHAPATPPPPPSPSPPPTSTAVLPAAGMRVSPGIAFVKVEALQPETTTKTLAGWTFTITRLDRIVAAQELAELEADLGIGAFPEIQFVHNTLRIARATDRHHDARATPPPPPVLTFDVRAVLRNAQAFYTTAEYTRDVAPQLVIPVSDSWANSQYARYDPKVDWAWRNNYFGLAAAAAAADDRDGGNDTNNNNKDDRDNDDKTRRQQQTPQLRPLQPGMPGINWELLSDRQLPILLYDAFDLFEDDLHDSGLVRCSVKFRAMPTAFFVLFRHLVRVDGHEVWLREVRCYHEFATTATAEPATVATRDARDDTAAAAADDAHDHHNDNSDGASSRIVFDEQIRKLSIRDTDDVSWRGLTDDALSQRATLLQRRQFYIDADALSDLTTHA